MGSYSEAQAAVRTYLEENWTETRLVFENEKPASPWPPQGPAAPGSSFPTMLPWAYFEMETMPGQSIRGVGVPGNHLSQTNGFILVHVFVPDGEGVENATEKAEAIGELFRARKLYEDDGSYLRTWVPRVGREVRAEFSGKPAGNWHGVTMSVPFQYFHRG